MNKFVYFLLFAVFSAVCSSPAQAQTTFTWGNNAGTAWATPGNWAAGTPGSSADPLNNDIALWNSGSTGTTIQMNFTNLGTPFFLGTLETVTGAVVKTLGSNTNTPGILQLNGTGVNSLILNHNGANAFTIAPQAGGGTGPLTLRLSAANSTINNSTATGTVTISANIVGTGTNGITKTGIGALTLSGTNTFTGGINLSGGTLVFNSSNAIAANNINVLAIGTVLNPTSTNATYANNFALPALDGRVTFLIPNNSLHVLNGTISGGNPNTDPTTVSGTEFFFQGGAGGSNTGVLRINGNNPNWQGTLNIQRGPLQIGSANALGTTVLRFDSNLPPAGIIQFMDSFAINNRIHIQSSVLGGVPGPSPIGVGVGLMGEITNTISSNGALGISKVGTGTLILSGTNTYTGATTVSAGMLQVGNGGTSGTLGTGNIAVNSGTMLSFNRSDVFTVNSIITGAGTLNQIGTGTTTLAGVNTFSGPVNILSGTLALGATGALPASTINVNSAAVFDVSALTLYTVDAGRTLQAGRSGTAANDLIGNFDILGNFRVGPTSTFRTATINGNLSANAANFFFDLGNAVTPGGGINDLVQISGNLQVAGTNTVNIIQPITGLANGSYTLFTYTGTLTGDATNFTVSGASGARQNLALSVTTPNAILLNVTGSPATLTWTGATNSNWDLVTTAGNFTGDPDNRFYNFDTVNFNNSATTGNVTVIGSLNPTAVNVNNTTLPYTFTGTGSIDGTGSLTKSGSGTLILATNNTYQGGTTISAGILQIGNGGATGSIIGDVVNNGSLVVNRTGALSLTGVVSGSGNLSVQGGVQLLLSGTNSYAGTTAISGGSQVTISSDASLGTAPGAATANFLTLDNATLAVGTNAVTLNANRGMTLGAGNGTIATGTATTYNGIIAGPGSLTKTGASTLTLGGANTYLGETTITAGTIAFTSNAAFSAGPISFGTGVASQAGFTGDPAGSVFFNNSTFADTTIANNITLPSPTANTTYTIRKDSAGGQLNLTGNISGGSANAKFFLNASAGGDNTTTIRFSGNNTFLAGVIETWRGGLIIASSNALGASTNQLRINANNNTVLGDLRFEFNGTFANPVELVGGGGGAINTNANTVTMSGVLSGSYVGGITKLGTGTLIVTNANTVSGNSAVNAGTLLVNNTTGSGTGTGNVTVNSTGTLGGTGTISGNVTLNTGTLAPGTSPGTLTVGGNVSGTGALTFDVATAGTPSSTNGGSNTGSSKDLLAVTGTVDVSGLTINPNSIGSSGFNNAQSYSWTVINTAGGLTGTPTLGTATGTDFTNLGGGTFSLATDANAVYLNFTPVPEPATILGLSALALTVVGGIRRRREHA